MGLLLLAMALLTFFMQYSKNRKLKSAMTLLQQEQDLFMQGSVMTFTWKNSANWPVEQVSKNAQALLGYSVEEFLDGSVQYASLVHPEDLQRVADEVVSSISEGDHFSHKQ